MWLPFLLILSLLFFLFLPLYSLLSPSSFFSLPPLSPFPLSLLLSLSILFLFILFFSSSLSSTFYLYHPFLLLPFLPEYFAFLQSILSLPISYPLYNLPTRSHLSLTLHFLPNSTLFLFLFLIQSLSHSISHFVPNYSFPFFFLTSFFQIF